MDLLYEVTCVVQQLSVISSDRDARFLNMYASLIRQYAGVRNATGRDGLCKPRYGGGDGEGRVLCSHCQTDPAVTRCLHEQCGRETKLSVMCVDCDRVLHKPPAKRSHIRVRLLRPVFLGPRPSFSLCSPTSSTLDLQLPASTPTDSTPPSLPPQHVLAAEPWLSRVTALFLGCLRDLLDDRKVCSAFLPI